MNDAVCEALCRTVLLVRDFVPDEVSDDAIVSGLRATNVAVFADARNLSSGACQSSVVTLVQLLVATGIGVRFVGPDVRLSGPQPPWTAPTLYGVLEEIRDRSVPSSRVVIGGEPTSCELSLVFGNTAACCTTGWRLRGSAWEGALVPLLTPTPRWVGDFPIGGLAVAALAAASRQRSAVARTRLDWSRSNVVLGRVQVRQPDSGRRRNGRRARLRRMLRGPRGGER